MCNYWNGKVKAPHIIWLTFRGIITRKLQGGRNIQCPPQEIGLKHVYLFRLFAWSHWNGSEPTTRFSNQSSNQWRIKTVSGKVIVHSSQRINRLRDYFWNDCNSVTIYQIIHLYMYDRYVSNDKSSPPIKIRSNRSIEKLHETNFRVIEVVIRCALLSDIRKVYFLFCETQWLFFFSKSEL